MKTTVYEAFIKAMEQERLRDRREAVLKVLNRHKGEEVELVSIKRTTGTRRAFRFDTFGGRDWVFTKGLLCVIDLNVSAEGEPRNVDLDAVLYIDVDGLRYDWTGDEGDHIPKAYPYPPASRWASYEEAKKEMDDLF